MIKDKLTRDERIRLECLAQAVASNINGISTLATLQKAKDYEKYIRGQGELSNPKYSVK